MQALENLWAENGLGQYSETVEPPPEGLLNATELQRNVQMLHPSFGSRNFSAGNDFEQASREGGFQWFALHAPEDNFFIIADRPVGWVADGFLHAPPSSLRHPSAYVLAPICRTLVLVGRHTSEPCLVTPAQVNAVMASWANNWIAGPTEATVRFALEDRHEIMASSRLEQ